MSNGELTLAGPSPFWSRRVLVAAVPGIVVATLFLVPFLGKAFTIDDYVFLRIAQQIAVDPLQPTAFDISWHDEPKRVSDYPPNGLVGAYLLAPVVQLNQPEWGAHLTWLGVLALAIIATASLALRLGDSSQVASTAGLMLASSPAVLAMASTSMPDVPGMALGVLGVERLLAWKEERRWHQGLATSVCFALAVLSRSQLALLVPIAAILLQPREGGRWRSWLSIGQIRLASPLLLVPLVLGLLLWGVSDAGSARAGIEVDSFAGHPRNPIAWAGHYALAMPLTLPWVAIRLRELPWSSFFVFTGVAAAYLFWIGDSRFLYMAPICGLTGTVLIDVVRSAAHKADLAHVTLATWLFIALPVVLFYHHFAPKYLVCSAPAVAILVARALATLPARRAQRIRAATLASCLGLALLITQADAVFAGLARRAATELIAPRVAAGERVWFVGNWGFQWYAEKAGAVIASSRRQRLRRGDLLVSSKLTTGSWRAKRFKSRQQIESLSQTSAWGHVMHGGAGFYSNAWGYLPWAPSRGLIDEFTLWRIR